MTLNQYQDAAKETAIYDPKMKIMYPILGLCSEAGEVAGKIKKILRDNNGQFTDADRLQINKELGDVLWYIAALATDLNITFEDIAMTNIQKLLSRKEAGTIQGSGDER